LEIAVVHILGVDPQPPTAVLVVNHPVAHATPQTLVNQALPTLKAAVAVDNPALALHLGTAVAQADGVDPPPHTVE